MKLVHILAFACLLIAGSATPVSATSTVKTPWVTKGAGKIELKNYAVIDEGRDGKDAWEQKLEIGYSFTDWWSAELEAKGEWSAEGWIYSSTEWENIFQLTAEGEYWADFGIMLGYDLAARPGDSDTASFKFIAGKKLTEWQHVFNLTLERDIGADRESGIDYGVAWQSIYHLDKQLSAGFEYFGDIGTLNSSGSFSEQGHKIGPYAVYRFDDMPYVLELGSLFGITSHAPDIEIKTEIAYRF